MTERGDTGRARRIVAASLVLGVGGVLGFLGALANQDPRTMSWRQYYGVARGIDEEGRFCIDNRESGLLCGRLRLADGAELPDDGKPVRGGYVKLPSDSSDLPEPSWLWVTELACGWSGTEHAPECDE